MNIKLSDHFTYRRLLRFTASPILMMIFTSLYSIVDGFFVSNYVGKTQFAAVNLVFPVTMIVSAAAFMIGAGGNAIISKTLGEGKKELANQYFSMLVYAAIGLSLVFSVIGFAFMPQIAVFLKAEGALKEACILYGRILFAAQCPFFLQNIFQQFFIVAEKPGLSLKFSVLAGVTNMILDFVFIAILKMGLAGAAIATVLGQIVGGMIPLIYFLRENDSLMRLTKTSMNWKVFAATCANGSSEMVSNLSASLVGILYNFQLMQLAGENGVAAYGVIMYVGFIFAAVFFGYASGSAPIVSYHFGAQNHAELKNLFRKSLVLTIVTGVLMVVISEAAAVPLVKIFTRNDAELFAMTCRGFRIYMLSCAFMGVNIWASSFFTALNNGGISAMLSFLSTLVFQIAAVLILPYFFKLDGVWAAVIAAELCSIAVSVFFLIRKKGDYHYA